eukprot:COSAG05_NODE_4387_length_1535_cov_1.391365_1_plen_48_part_00
MVFQKNVAILLPAKRDVRTTAWHDIPWRVRPKAARNAMVEWQPEREG